jgi:RNA polymerase sigma-70 factor (ECF subfamily)
MEVESAPAVGADVADEVEATALRARDDRTAFAALYVRHREAVYRYLRARCASDDDALELTAVTFERALAAMPRYTSRGGGVVAWLLRIARNAVIDEERKRRPLVPQWKTPEATSAEPTPEEAAIGAEERRALRRLLADLPEVQRDALALRYGTGLTARQIGGVIDKSEEATQKLINRAVARLKEGLS